MSRNRDDVDKIVVVKIGDLMTAAASGEYPSVHGSSLVGSHGREKKVTKLMIGML